MKFENIIRSGMQNNRLNVADVTGIKFRILDQWQHCRRFYKPDTTVSIVNPYASTARAATTNFVNSDVSGGRWTPIRWLHSSTPS